MAQRGRPRHPGLLTSREDDVLVLLREGLTNEQIADRLGISFETAKHHVSEILSKLNVTTREQAAAWSPDREATPWTPARVMLAFAGTAVVAAAVAGLALLAWGVSESGDSGSGPPEPDGLAECLDSAGRQPTTGDDFGVSSRGVVVCWETVPLAASYVVSMSVEWVACSSLSGPGSVELVDETIEAAGGRNWAELPSATEPQYRYLNRVTAAVEALEFDHSHLRNGSTEVIYEWYGDCVFLPPGTPTPFISPTPNLPEVDKVPDPPRLAYEDQQGIVWIVGSQGGNQFRLTDQCPAVDMQWSPDGQLLACSYVAIRIFDLQGRLVWSKDDTPPLGWFIWAPDSRRFAYRDTDGAIHIGNVADESDLVLAENGVPLEWPQDGRMLAGLNYEELDLGQDWDPYWIDVATGAAEAAPELDETGILLFPDSQRAVVTRRDADGNPEMAIHEFATGAETAVSTGGTPMSPVAMSPDGLTFYAIQRADLPPTATPVSPDAAPAPAGGMHIHECNVEEMACVSLGTVPGYLIRVSGDGLVSYLEPGDYWEPMRIRDMKTGSEVYIGVSTAHMAWWP